MFIFLFLNIQNSFADIPQDWLLWELKYDSSNVYLNNITFGWDYAKYNKTWVSPNWYISTTSSSFIYYSTGNIPNENIKMISFWYNYYNTSWEIFSNNDLILKTIWSNQVQVLYKWEQIWIMSLTWWNLLSMYIDNTNKKLKIYVNWNQSIYSFSIDRKNLIESKDNTIKYCYLSSVRLYNRVLTEQELNNIYNEKNNTVKPTLTLWTGSINFNTSIENLNMTLWKISDSNTWSLSLFYSINWSLFLPIDWIIYDTPISNQALNLSFSSDKFYYWPNTLQLKAYDWYEYSNIVSYTINKNFFAEPDVSKWTLLWSFHFKGNLLSETWSSYLAWSTYSYTATWSFPNRYITTTLDTYNIYLNNSTSNIETLVFWYKWDWNLFDNNYINLAYEVYNWFILNKSWNLMFLIGPKNDTNWHLISLQLDKNDDKLYINIDWWKYKNSLAYYKDSLYYSSDWVNWLKFKKWSFAFVKMYSSKLSDEEILTLYNFYKNTTPSLITTSSWYTLKSTDDYLNIPVIINDDDVNQSIEYYYSIDNINYIKFDWINSLTPALSWSLNLSISWSIFNNWLNSLYLRANDWKINSNTLTLSINKTLNNMNISIDESWLYINGDKTIKASINIWTLYYSITNNNTCDNTLSFLPYQNLTFSNSLDNWKRVCYKWVYWEEIIYKLSSEINNIWTQTVWIKKSDIFYNHLYWKKSTDIKDFDPLYILIKSIVTKNYSTTQTSYTYPSSIIDVNWDWLPDLIITNYYKSDYSYNNNTRTENQYYYWLLINKWNMDYDVVYRCVNYSWWAPIESWMNKSWFYWDCAK